MASELARLYPEKVQALVLLSGPTDELLLNFFESNKDLPIFTAVSSEDWAVEAMKQVIKSSGNNKSEYHLYENAGHGTDMFIKHLELEEQISEWFLRFYNK